MELKLSKVFQQPVPGAKYSCDAVYDKKKRVANNHILDDSAESGKIRTPKRILTQMKTQKSAQRGV